MGSLEREREHCRTLNAIISRAKRLCAFPRRFGSNFLSDRFGRMLNRKEKIGTYRAAEHVARMYLIKVNATLDHALAAEANEPDQRSLARAARKSPVAGPARSTPIHTDAIWSCTLVIRQPQLITRASNIYTRSGTALYTQTHCNLSCFALTPDHVAEHPACFSNERGNPRATSDERKHLALEKPGKIFKFPRKPKLVN